MHTMETIKNRRRRQRIHIPLCDETELGCLNNWMTAIPVKLPLKGGGTEEKVLFVNPASEESCLYKKDCGRYEREDGSEEFRRPKRVKLADIFCCFDGFCGGRKIRRNEIWLGPYLMQKDGAVIDFGIGAFYKLKYGMGSETNNE